MSRETLQYDMFLEQYVDARSEAQKKRDRERAQPQQVEMFAAVEVAQFGVNPRPLLSLSEHTRLTLWQEDPRTDEERAADRQQAIEQETYQLFGQRPELDPGEPEAADDRAGQSVAEIPAPISASAPAGPSAAVAEVEGQAGATETTHDRIQEREALRLHAPFFNVLARAAYPDGANHRENLTPGALAALNEQMVEHIQREVSREGFWEVDWAQEALEEWLWNFLDMYCLIEGDMEAQRATVRAILDTAQRLWGNATQEEHQGVGQGDTELVVADETTLSLVVYGFWDWPPRQVDVDEVV